MSGIPTKTRHLCVPRNSAEAFAKQKPPKVFPLGWGFLFLLLTERLQGLGDLITKAALGLMLGAGVWLIVEQIVWHVCNGIRQRSHRKTRDD